MRISSISFLLFEKKFSLVTEKAVFQFYIVNLTILVQLGHHCSWPNRSVSKPI